MHKITLTIASCTAVAMTLSTAATADAKTRLFGGYSPRGNTVYMQIDTDRHGRETATAYTQNKRGWKTKRVTLVVKCIGVTKVTSGNTAAVVSVPTRKHCSVTATGKWKRWVLRTDTASVKVAVK